MWVTLSLLLSILIPLTTAEVSLEDFFPFGIENEDEQLARVDDGSSPPITLLYPFPFFDVSQPNLWVNENGLISFSTKIAEFTPFCKPAPSQYRMIAPFWADIDISRSGDIFYRQTTNESVLRQGETEIARAFPNEKNIQFVWAFIATWANVTYFDDLGDTDEAERKRNTFQLALFTDGSLSFALFYYNEISWTSGDVSGGTNGLGGTAAEVGYDYGDGKNYFMVNSSCSSSVLNISQTSNIGSPGKWIFQTNVYETTPTTPPGCSKNYTGEFCVTPNTITVFGAGDLDITGVKLSSTESALCRYYDPSANTSQINANIITLTHITCARPGMFFTSGRIKMEVEIWSDQMNSKNRTYTGYLYVKHSNDGDNTLGVKVNATTREILFSWNPKAIPAWIGAQSANFVAKMVFVHYCAKAINSPPSITVTTVMPISIDQLFQGMASSYIAIPGTEGFENKGIWDKICPGNDPAHLLCSFGWNLVVNTIKTGPADEFPLVDLYNVGKSAIMAYATGCILPNAAGGTCKYILDHHTFHSDEIDYIESSTESTSNFFSTTESSEDEWPSFQIPIDVPPCPPTENLASLDPTFMVDPECCDFNPGVDSCYISAAPSPSGGAQRCCYKSGQIYIKAPGAGYALIAHPSLNAGFTHQALDVSPWLYCCYLLLSKDLCNQLFHNRQPDSGNNYTSPTGSLGNGDAHFTTFDKLYYTFNGAGEFWLLKNTTEQPLAVQARMILTDGLSSRFSLLGAYALKSPSSSVVQVEISSDSINVYYDCVPLPDELWQSGITFNDVTISYFDSSVVVTYGLGFSFKFSLYSLTAFADTKYKGNYTHGILGIYDGNPFDDLTSPNGILIPANSTTEIIHYKFGLKWYVSEEESLFDYFGKNYSAYYYPNFKPDFGYSPGDLPPNAAEICGDDPSCLWDLITTGNEALANATRNAHEDFNNTVSSTNVTINMCPTLNMPEDGYFTLDNYLPNSTALFECNPNYELVGDAELVCLSDGYWNGTEPMCVFATTEVPTTKESSTKSTPPESTTGVTKSSQLPTTSSGEKNILKWDGFAVFVLIAILGHLLSI